MGIFDSYKKWTETRQKNKCQRDIIEYNKRLDNMENGKASNEHHKTKALQALADLNGAGIVSNAFTLTSLGLGAAVLTGAAPPIGIACTAVAASGIVINQFTTAHKNRKSLRDIERMIKVQNSLQKKLVNTTNPKELALLAQVKQIKAHSLAEYRQRFCEQRNIVCTAVDPQGRIVSAQPKISNALKKTNDATTKIEQSAQKTKEHLLRVSEKADKAHLSAELISRAVGAAEILESAAAIPVAGAALKIASTAMAQATRSQINTRMSNVDFARVTANLVTQAKEAGISMQEHAGDVSTIIAQHNTPLNYINRWHDTKAKLANTSKKLEAVKNALNSDTIDKAKLTEHLASLEQDKDHYHSVETLAEDKLRIWRKNPFKQLAQKLDTKTLTAEIAKLPEEAALAKAKELIAHLEQHHQEAVTRNNKLVGQDYAEKHENDIASPTHISHDSAGVTASLIQKLKGGVAPSEYMPSKKKALSREVVLR